MKKRLQEKRASTGIRLKPGAHASLILSGPDLHSDVLAFAAEGMKNGEACAILAYSRFNERLAAQLRDLHGVDTRRSLVDGTLAFVGVRENAKLMSEELEKYFAQARKLKRSARLLTSLGWGENGWPDENELLHFDAGLNELCREYGAAALCLYDARQLSGQIIVVGALQCHPQVFCRGVAHRNPLFVDPSILKKELSGRRREASRLEAWLT
jgi:hypothetical protein